MNNGRMWTVVNPTVGLPLFFVTIALTSMTVHHAVLNNTTWFGDFLRGASKPRVSMENTVAPVASLASADQAGFAINVVPTQSSSGASSFVITVTPKADGPTHTALVTTPTP